jgi:hypothetical protein
MGTAHEWFLVFGYGVFFGGLMGLTGLPQPKFAKAPRLYWALYIMRHALLGLLFGIAEALREWQPFRPPLVYLSGGIFVCALLLSLPLRRFNRTLPRLPKKPGPFPVPDFLTDRKQN